jgi:uncharacterized protein DUF2846
MKSLFGAVAVSCLAAVSLAAQAPLKVYLDSPNMAAAVKALHDHCAECSPVIKRDGADFLVLLSESNGKLMLSVFESSTGGVIKESTVGTVDLGVTAAVAAIRSHPAASAAASNAGGTATVYVYRYKQYSGGALEPSVFCDETEVARMDNGRYFMLALKPGKHLLRSNDKQSGVELDVKGGEEQYIRVEIVTGFMKGHGRLVLVQPGQGTVEVHKLQPLGADKIKDTALVKTQ